MGGLPKLRPKTLMKTESNHAVRGTVHRTGEEITLSAAKLRRFMGEEFGSEDVRIFHKVDFKERTVRTRHISDVGVTDIKADAWTSALFVSTGNRTDKPTIIPMGELKLILEDIEEILPILKDGNGKNRIATNGKAVKAGRCEQEFGPIISVKAGRRKAKAL